MPSKDVAIMTGAHLSDETFALSDRALYPDVAGWEARPDVFADAWAASGSGCSLLAHGIEQRIAEVIFDGAVSGAYGMRWDLVVLGAPPAPDGDIEHPVVLPAQPREHARVLRGTVRRVTRPWAGLALTDEELESVYVGEGDA
jgi:hypothetical protein